MSLRETFKREGLDISKQAEHMILQLNNPFKAAIEIIKQAKKRRIIIAGGDVLKFILKGRITNSIINSEDIGN